jgi:sRNA-binding carbon storage regulator CsrA
MLCIGRQPKQSTVILVPPSDKPTLVEVHQAEIRGDKSTLAFDAPAEVRIYRRELYDTIAAAVKPGDVQPLK